MVGQGEPNVGARIRETRERQRLSLSALARLCGLSINAISRIERGENSPTVSSLHRLATALDVPITDFFHEEDSQAVVFVKRDQRLRSHGDGVLMESLGIGLRNQQLEPFLKTIEPGAGNMSDPISHSGEKFIYCLEGEVNYCIDDVWYRLRPGDSLLFDARQPHCFRNTSGAPSTILVVFQATGRILLGPSAT